MIQICVISIRHVYFRQWPCVYSWEAIFIQLFCIAISVELLGLWVQCLLCELFVWRNFQVQACYLFTRTQENTISHHHKYSGPFSFLTRSVEIVQRESPKFLKLKRCFSLLSKRTVVLMYRNIEKTSCLVQSNLVLSMKVLGFPGFDHFIWSVQVLVNNQVLCC